MKVRSRKVFFIDHLNQVCKSANILYLCAYLCHLRENAGGQWIIDFFGSWHMQTKQAIISFSQSEKVKSGLIWCTHCAQLIQNMSPAEQPGGLQLLQSLLAGLVNEVQLAARISGDAIWLEVDKLLNNARVMVDSGVAHDAEYHFTQALSQVNCIGQRAMTDLMDKGLLD